MEFKQSSATISYHQSMLADSLRVRRYREAIQRTVREGDVVLDIGSGSGILSFFCCQAGASRVYAVEGGTAIEIARLLARANGFEERVVLLNEASWRVELPEPVDVVVTETLWNFGIGEGLLRWTCDARERLLKEGGTIIPAELALMVAPVELPQARSLIDTWAPEAYGLDLSAMRSPAANNVYRLSIPADALLAGAETLARPRTLEVAEPDVSGQASFVTTRDGVVHGLGGWFDAELAPGVRLSNGPRIETTSWSQAFFPLEQPLELAAGTKLRARIRTTGADQVWSWGVSVGDESSDSALSQSTFFGFPFSPERLGRQAPDWSPRLSRMGEIQRFVLESCDGSTPAEELESELTRRFPDTFADRDDAATFLADLLEAVAE
jgi:protein arginine N-methyltransferase 1